MSQTFVKGPGNLQQNAKKKAKSINKILPSLEFIQSNFDSLNSPGPVNNVGAIGSSSQPKSNKVPPMFLYFFYCVGRFLWITFDNSLQDLPKVLYGDKPAK